MWFKIIAVLTVAGLAKSSIEEPRKLYRTKEVQQIDRFNDPFDGVAYRLPNATVPLRYDIWLSTDVHSGNFSFEGRVTIQIQAVENTPDITLHYRELTIVNVNLLSSSGDLIQSNVPITTRSNVEFMIITPATPLIQGQVYSVEISYLGVLRDDDAGFYRSSYIDNLGTRKWLATTQFESTDARHAFPCFDEPAIRSRYSIEIKHDTSYTAISNMPQASRTSVPGTNYVVTKFEEIPSMQSYLIAFTVSDFTFADDNTSSVPQRVFAKPQSISNGEARLALDVSGKILEEFESYLGVDFELPKMDQAAMPDFAAGAMENWGLVTYREQYLLFNEATGTTRDRENVVTTICHEFAHQWFGNYVSPAWWSYLWLNEGFATLFENYMLSLVFPQERWVDTFLIDTVQPVMESDSSPNIRPMSYYVENPDRIDGIFDEIAYSKSGSVLKMFQNVFGDSTWKKGLTTYLNARRLNFALPEHLYQGIQVAVDQDLPIMSRPNVAAVMRTWETQSGFPYITVSRTGSQLTFEQNRFLYTNRTSPNVWWVPINYVVGSNPNFTVTKPDLWLEVVRSVTIQSSQAPKAFTASDWIVVNIQQSSYYRVNYDANLWSMIIAHINKAGNEFNQVHLFNRAQLIDDSFHLARAGIVNFDTVFGIMNYLEKETDYIPWASTNRANTLLNRWLSGSSVYSHYQTFMRKNVQAIFTRLGTEIISNEQRVDRYARSVAINIACQSQHEACLQQTTQRLANMLFDGISIAPDLVSVIYCNGIRAANATVFTALQNKFLQSNVQSERYALIAGLGCTQDPNLLTSYLNLAIDSGATLTALERSRILTSSINIGETSIRTLMNFVRANSQAIANINLSTTVFNNIASRISNEALFDEFSALLDLARTNSLLSETQIATYRASASSIINWQATNLRHIESFFGIQQVTSTTQASSDNPTSTTQASSDNPTSTESTTLGAANIVVSSILLATSLVVKYLL